MKIKIILILSILFLVSGCKAEYNLSFEKDTFKESMYLFDTSETFFAFTNSKEGVEKISKEMFKLEGTREDFTRRLKYNTSFIGYQYESSFKLNDHSTLPTIASTCYDEIKIKKGNIVTIDTSNEFLCFDKFPYTSEVTIRFTTPYTIIKSNADEIDGKIYKWNITKEDNQKPIHIEIKVKEETSIFTLKNIIISISIVGISFIIYMLYKNVKKKNDFS